MTALKGKLLRYEYENGDMYQVLFGEDTATWTYGPGSENPVSGTENHDVVEIVPNVFFVSWSESTGEVVSFVANLNEMEIHTSYVYENTRHFWKGSIKYFGKPDE